MGALLDEQRGKGGPTPGESCLDRPRRQTQGVGDLLHGEVSQVVQRDAAYSSWISMSLTRPPPFVY